MLRFGVLIAFLCCCFITVNAFGGSEDRFIKKYAMMKIYESCFGPEVVKQIRKEMKAACAKCAALEAPPPVPSRPPPTQAPFPDQKLDGIANPENQLFANQQTFDSDKLHQAILAYRPNPVPVPSFRPYPGGAGFYQGFPNPGISGPMFYPGFQQSNPFGAATPFGFPLIAQPYYGSQRMSREMDIRGQLEVLTSRMSGKVKNVTCVMQELGYLDDNLEPNYAKISERIGSLPVSEELRRDMQDGVTFCQQFSQCVPEVKKEKSPLSRELIRPMFFFKCYKHKKLEACIMKDVRDKYTGVTEDDFDGEMELRRTGKSARITRESEIDDLATSMYEFLYGSDSAIEFDSFF